jgi:hypothetical protein
MKVIQVPMDKKLLRAVTGTAKALHLTRAALIRRACEEHLHRLGRDELERRYVEGYRRKPEKPALGNAGAKLAAEVWPKHVTMNASAARRAIARPDAILIKLERRCENRLLFLWRPSFWRHC